MHDGVYSFELGIVSFDIVLEHSGFARDPQIFSLSIRIDRSAGSYRELALLGHRTLFAGRFLQQMEFGSRKLGFPVVTFSF